MSRKTLAADSDTIDLALDELSKLIIRLDKNPTKTRREQNMIKKIQEIRDAIEKFFVLRLEILKKYRLDKLILLDNTN